MVDAKQKNKEFGKKAAAAAAAWGRALKASEKAQSDLTAATATAEADLKAHVDAQPSVELLETTASSGSAKCKAAKSEAYQQCRDHQNAAYLSCESMYKNGCGAACASPTGSG